MKEQHHAPDPDAKCIEGPQRRNEGLSTQKVLICQYGNELEPHLNYFFGEMKGNRRVAPRSRTRKAPLRAPKRPKPAGQKKRKLKVPKIPIKLQGSPPSYFELLQEAVQTLKDMSKGASLPEIRQHLQRKYRGSFDKESNDLLTTALQRLAERGKVIRKEGFRYRFNQPNDVSKSTDTSAASSFTGTNGSRASQSCASSGYVPTESGATAASSSFSDTNHSKESDHGEAPEDEARENFDDEGKSSTGGLSSSAPSASSTASRASSKRR
jgi:hypothetical protein